MTDLHIPQDVIDAQRAYDTADAAVHKVCERLPSGAAIAAGEAKLSDEQRAELGRVRAERLDRLEALRGHPWWKQAGDPLRAEAALRKAAREGAHRDHAAPGKTDT